MPPDYEPSVMSSFFVRAKQRGCTALEALYDHFAEGDGGNLVYFPIFNYNDGHLDVIGSVESAQFQQHGTHQLLSQLAVALEGDDRERT